MVQCRMMASLTEKRLVLALRVVIALFLAINLLACGGLKEAGEDARSTEAAIKADLGLDAAVSYSSFSGTGGTKVRVTVRLKSLPTGDAAETKTKVVDIVNRNFRSHVDSVAVSF